MGTNCSFTCPLIRQLKLGRTKGEKWDMDGKKMRIEPPTFTFVGFFLNPAGWFFLHFFLVLLTFQHLNFTALKHTHISSSVASNAENMIWLTFYFRSSLPPDYEFRWFQTKKSPRPWPMKVAANLVPYSLVAHLRKYSSSSDRTENIDQVSVSFFNEISKKKVKTHRFFDRRSTNGRANPSLSFRFKSGAIERKEKERSDSRDSN